MLALKSDGTVYAWGGNYSGQLGDGTNVRRTTPIQITTLPSIVAIAAGHDHSVALTGDGTVYLWGSNGNGQFGNNSVSTSWSPVPVSCANTRDPKVSLASTILHELAHRGDGGEKRPFELEDKCFGCRPQ